MADSYPGLSPYNYTMGNPINLVDPTGMCPEEAGFLDCLFAKIGEIFENSSIVDINLSFGEDGEITATSEVSKEQTMMANAMLADLEAQGESIERLYNGLGYIPGVDVAQDLYEGDYGSAALNAATLFIPGGKIASTGGRALYKFGGKEFVEHFAKHGDEFAKVFGNPQYGLSNYYDDISHLLTNGRYVPELNGYVKLIGGKGSAKYGFVGLDQSGKTVTTFHIKSAKELSKKAPSLGINY